jgi:GT2 family glycosyltransferase
MMNTVASLAIPNYNGAGKINIFLESLLKQNYPLDKVEVVIGDDASTDESLDVITSYLKKGLNIRIGKNETRKGRASALNLALGMAQGEIVIICDNDFELAPYFILEHLKSHREESRTIVVGPLENRHERKYIYTDFLDWYQKKQNRLCMTNRESLPFIYFRANSSLKRSEFRNMDIFNEAFNAWGYEDVECGYRLVKMGYKLKYNSRALVYHHLNETDFAVRCSRNYTCGKNKAIAVSQHPAMRYDIYCLKPDCRKISARVNYFLRRAVCTAITHIPFISEDAILKGFYRLTKLFERLGLKFPLFALYHCVSGLFLDVSYFKHSIKGKCGIRE